MIKTPIHIVINRRKDYSISGFVDTEWDNGEELCSRYSWTWAVYRMLKFAGHDISVGYTYKEGAINIVHYYGVMAAGIKPHKFFTVYLRADYRSMPFAHLQVVQNKTQINAKSVWIKHHPQPGLRPRDSHRDEISNVAFFGSPANTVKLSSTTLETLKNEGLNFLYNTDFSDRADYSTVDIAIGIREFSERRFDHKPGTKMTNAWLAGIPFVGGVDSAFEQNGKPGHDYIRVSKEPELIANLITLKNDPSLYAALIANSRDIAKDYTFEACSAAWSKLIEHKVHPVYSKWKKRSRTHKIIEYCAYLSYVLKERYVVKGFSQLKKRFKKN
ncbi:glycosyltransferase [Parapedobacter tibetensis]|uniref:glycosyltransferase n=1 Tax=Parapedobacter tibetensis TaxID=2972951 RepID=UPI00214DB139|nr:hypothetical protein [Parapedobacter tibetensis]